MKVKIEKNKLKNYQQWVQANKDTQFSLFDYIHGVFQTQEFAPDLSFAFLQLFWPDFILHNTLVFLKEEFYEGKYLELKEQGHQGKDLEYWMNLLSIDGILGSCSFEEAACLGDSIAVLWNKKLEADFSDREFEVNCLKDEYLQEVYVTFFQKCVS